MEIKSINRSESEFHTTLNKCKEDVAHIIDCINSINGKLEECLKKEEFNIQLEILNNSSAHLDNKIISLQNNINPYALIIPQTNEQSSQSKSTPDAFLKYLFDIFQSNAKILIKEQDAKITYIESLLSAFEKKVNMSLYNAAKKAVGQFKARGELTEQTTHKEIYNSFHDLISKKCDYSELQLIDDYKANKTDLESLHLNIEQTNEKINYVLTLLTEFIRTMINVDSKSKGELKSKLSYIAYQFSLIAKSGETINKKKISNDMSLFGLRREEKEEEYPVGIKVKSSKKIDTHDLNSSYFTEGHKRLATASAHKRRFCSSTMGYTRNSYRNTQKAFIHRPYQHPH